MLAAFSLCSSTTRASRLRRRSVEDSAARPGDRCMLTMRAERRRWAVVADSMTALDVRAAPVAKEERPRREGAAATTMHEPVESEETEVAEGLGGTSTRRAMAAANDTEEKGVVMQENPCKRTTTRRMEEMPRKRVRVEACVYMRGRGRQRGTKTKASARCRITSSARRTWNARRPRDQERLASFWPFAPSRADLRSGLLLLIARQSTSPPQ